MKKPVWLRAVSIAGIALSAVCAFSAAREQAGPTSHSAIACLQDFENANGMRYKAVRIVDDRATKNLWLLVRQLNRPEAPALLLQMTDDHACSRLLIVDSDQGSSTVRLPSPVIRPGDSVILSEDSPISDSRLQAIALEAAAPGQVLTVRLKLGGHLLRAVATAHGSALLTDRNEVR